MNEQSFDVDAERGVLACLLAGEATAYQDAVAQGLKAEWFYDLRHAEVFRVVGELELAGTPASLISVHNHAREYLEDLGGLSYLSSLPDCTPSVAMLPVWMDQCRSALLKRKAAAIASETADLAGGGEDGETLLRGLAGRATEALDSVTQADSEHGKLLSERLVDNLERKKALADAGKRSGIETGLHGFDSKTDGLQAGEQCIIGARPSEGKTALGLTLVDAIAIRGGVPTLVISCEMSIESLMMRLCAIHTGVSLNALRYGKYQDAEAMRIMTFSLKLAQAPLYIFDAISGISGAQASAIIRQHARRHGVRFVLVDYLQKIRPEKKAEKRTYEVAEVSGALRSAAVSSKVALVTLAQLSRDSEKGSEPRPPRLTDLADSAQIERDADTVALLHRDKQITSKASLNIAKQRDGETGVFNLYFNGPITRFENPPPEHD